MKPKENLCGRPTRFTPELGNIIKYYLKCHWSPEQIVGRLLQTKSVLKPSIDGLTLI